MQSRKYIRSAVEFGTSITFGVTTESSVLDFKGTYGNGVDQSDEIRKDLTSFANTSGGTLLIGVTEGVGANSHKVAAGLLANDIERLKSKISDAMAGNVFPVVPFTFHAFEVAHEGISVPVLAVCVQPNPHGPVARWASQGGAIYFYFRDEYGVKSMHPTDVFRRSSTARASWIKLEEMFEAKIGEVELPDGYFSSLPTGRGNQRYWHHHANVKAQLVRYSQDAIELAVAQGHHIVVPMGFVTDVWTTFTNSVALMLDCRIMYHPAMRGPAAAPARIWIESNSLRRGRQD